MLNYKFSTLNRMDLGDRIRRARRVAGLSPGDLARAVGVTKGAISQWENNEVKNIRLGHLFKLQDATGFNARWIALEEGPERGEPQAKDPRDVDDILSGLESHEIAILLRAAADQLTRK